MHVGDAAQRILHPGQSVSPILRTRAEECRLRPEYDLIQSTVRSDSSPELGIEIRWALAASSRAGHEACAHRGDVMTHVASFSHDLATGDAHPLRRRRELRPKFAALRIFGLSIRSRGDIMTFGCDMSLCYPPKPCYLGLPQPKLSRLRLPSLRSPFRGSAIKSPIKTSLRSTSPSGAFVRIPALASCATSISPRILWTWS